MAWNYSETHLEYEGKEGVKDPFDQLLEIGASDYMSANFVERGPLHYIFQHEQNDELGEIDEKMHVSPACMFSLLCRVSVGAAYRMKRIHIIGDKKEDKQAQYLCQNKLNKFNVLGKIITQNPLPFPIRTYDMPTHFQRECAAESFPNLFGFNNQADHYKILCIYEVNANVLEQLILTSLIVRTTGRVERLREYLVFTQKQKAKTPNWKRLFDSGDCSILPLFIASTSGIRDSSEAYNQSAAMTQWFTDQFKKIHPIGSEGVTFQLLSLSQ